MHATWMAVHSGIDADEHDKWFMFFDTRICFVSEYYNWLVVSIVNTMPRISPRRLLLSRSSRDISTVSVLFITTIVT